MDPDYAESGGKRRREEDVIWGSLDYTL